MANVFKPKRSSTASSVPTTSNLADGELAVNSADQKIYLREGSNIVEVGNTSGGISSVFEDTTPQLGGTLETNGNTIDFGDDDKLRFGANQELEIYYNTGNGNSIIQENGGSGNLILNADNLIIRNSAANENKAKFVTNGSAILYHNAVEKFRTTSIGASVYGTLEVGTDVTIYGNSGIVSATDFSGGGSNLTGLTGASAATYGDSGSTPVITVDANGRITGITTAAVSSGGGTMSDLVDDTTPQLGGNLDVNGKNINFGDSASASDDRLNFGAGTDLSIYFDGTNSYIDVNPDAANHLYIRNNVGSDQNGDIRLQAKSGENSIICYDDSSVELYFDNSVKLTTTSTGFSVTGTGLGNWKANDNSYLTAGTGDDLQIYHDGNHSYLDNDKGHLYIRNNVDGDVGGDIRLMPHDNENGIIIYDDSGVELYCDNSVKLTTTDTGFTVTGTGLGNFKSNDNSTLTAGTGDDFQIYHNGSHTYLDNDTGHLYIRNNVDGDVGGDIRIMPHDNENGIIIYDDAGVELYYNNVAKLTTTSEGVTVNGTLGVTTLAFNDNQTMTFGNGDDLSIYHGVSNNIGHSYIDNDTGHLYIRNNVGGDVGGDIRLMPHDNENGIIIYDDSGVELYCDNSVKLTTTSTGFSVTGTGLGNFKANDNSYLTAGTGDDLQIYHDGTSSYLDNDTGHLFIRNNVGGDVGGDIRLMPHDNEYGIIIYDDSGVELYCDNSVKLTTTDTGFTVTGTGLGNFKANDNSYLTAGTGDDFQIYHDGTSSYLDNDTGHLFIRNNVASDVGGNIYIRPHDNENGIVIHDDGAVELYHDNNLKLATTSSGINVTGTCEIGGLKVNDSAYITAGLGDDLQIYHTGSHAFLDNDTGHFYIRNNVDGDVGGNIFIRPHDDEEGIVIINDGAVRLYYDNSTKFETTGIGVSIVGTGNTATIAGPSELVLDPGTVGDNTGKVVILGNLQVDGTQTVINSTTLTVDDKSIVLASGAADSSAANGAGIEVDGASATFQYAHSGTKWVANKDLQAEAFIKNGGTSSEFLKADGSVDTSTYLTSVPSGYLQNLSEDTTPQLGGPLETNGNTIDFGDSSGSTDDRLRFGAGQDLQIWHNGSNSYITQYSDVGDLYLNCHNDDNDVIIQTDNGSGSTTDYFRADGSTGEAKLFYYGSEKIKTANTGVTITGTASATEFSGGGSNLTGLTGASAATYGDSGSTPVITVDANGRITGITTAAVSGGGGGSTTRTVHRYVATANQTLFPSSGTITYTVGYVDVFLNGTKLDSTEFTATNGTTVTLTTGATVSDIVELIAFSDVSLSGGGNFNELDAALFS